MNLREELLERKPPMQPVEAWGRTLYVRKMSGRSALSFAKWTDKQKKKADDLDQIVQLLLRTVCDEDGNLVFLDRDAKWLADQAMDDLEPLFDQAIDLNGLSDDDVEQAAGNSDATQD